MPGEERQLGSAEGEKSSYAYTDRQEEPHSSCYHPATPEVALCAFSPARSEIPAHIDPPCTTPSQGIMPNDRKSKVGDSESDMESERRDGDEEGERRQPRRSPCLREPLAFPLSSTRRKAPSAIPPPHRIPASPLLLPPPQSSAPSLVQPSRRARSPKRPRRCTKRCSRE